MMFSARYWAYFIDYFSFFYGSVLAGWMSAQIYWEWWGRHHRGGPHD